LKVSALAPLRVGAHAAPGRGESLVHFRFGYFDAEALGLVQFQNFVDQAVHHFLARRYLFRAQLHELGAMLDVEGGDRRAIDEGDDLLRPRGGGNAEHDHDAERDRNESPAAAAGRSLQHQLLLPRPTAAPPPAPPVPLPF
jgi:hypothetical protein